MIADDTAMTEQTTQPSNLTSRDRASGGDDVLNHIRESLRGLRFGSVNIIVQDGVVIQIDRTEKRRLRTNRNQP